ncbi:hypothetical protein GCM10011446_32880 [Acinetobacter vivianii]|nr:hypothetical protein GCM10011446_32880 [Acinetobacter vivianii]
MENAGKKAESTKPIRGTISQMAKNSKIAAERLKPLESQLRLKPSPKELILGGEEIELD